MSSDSVDVNDLVEAVGEDPDLTPDQKETTIRLAKDGEPDENAPVFEYDVAHICTEEAGLCRRWLQNPDFTLTKIRVNDSKGEGRVIQPDDYSGGKVTAIWGYLPVDTLTGGKSRRKSSNHSDIAPYHRSTSNRSQSQSPDTSPSTSSGSVTEEQAAMDNTEDSNDEESDYKATDPLDW